MKTSIATPLQKMMLLLMISMAFVACSDKSKFEIGGKFEHATPQSKVYLFGINKNQETAIDSTVLSDKGEFKFSNSTPDVDFFKIKIDNKEYILIAKNGDVIKLISFF